jgi:hypothetical protein
VPLFLPVEMASALDLVIVPMPTRSRSCDTSLVLFAGLSSGCSPRLTRSLFAQETDFLLEVVRHVFRAMVVSQP